MGTAIGQAAGQAWPPFVLVAGLLLIGIVVEADGLFVALVRESNESAGVDCASRDAVQMRKPVTVEESY